jgi:uncharacterized tellurite resistance protein B-like protein
MNEKARGELGKSVRAHMSGADEDTVRMVTALAGLLACVAYADRQYTESEREQVRSVLSGLQGLPRAGVEAVCALLDENISALAATAFQNYLRDLRELADHDTRMQVLEVLMELAAADDVVSTPETNLLRRTASGLGLSADDYHQVQARYRDKLSVLKG